MSKVFSEVSEEKEQDYTHTLSSQQLQPGAGNDLTDFNRKTFSETPDTYIKEVWFFFFPVRLKWNFAHQTNLSLALHISGSYVMDCKWF